MRKFSLNHGHYYVKKILAHIGRLEGVTIFFAVLFLILFLATFQYTIIDGAYYRELADRQQTMKITNNVSRGAIYTSNDPVGVLATSADLPDLAVDPSGSGSREELISFLVKAFRREACGISFDLSCIERSYQIIRTPLPIGETVTQQKLDILLGEYIRQKLSPEFISSVLVKEGLSDEDISKISTFVMQEGFGSGMYFVSNNLYINPLTVTFNPTQRSSFIELANISNTTLDRLLEKRRVRYVKLLNQISFDTKEYIESELQSIKKQNSKSPLLSAIILEPHPSRYYPQKYVGSQITGFVDGQGIGRYGVESFFQKELQGQDGARLVKKDINGRIIEDFDLSKDRSVNGVDLTLTIDHNVQKFVQDRLVRAARDFGANRTSAVVMDPRTGRVIAMATAPDYDPNEYGKVYDIQVLPNDTQEDADYLFLGLPLFVEDSNQGENKIIDGRAIKLRLATDEERQNPLITKYQYKNKVGPLAYINDPIGSLYEPGSVFKSITVAIGIDSGEIRPNDTYYDPGFIKIDQFTIKNLAKECIGQHTYRHALDWSCNVGMIDIVRKVGKNIFSEYIQNFGFGQKTEITMDGEVYSQIPSVDRWTTSTLYTSSFGQGIAATVLQMATAYSVIANGGVYMKPYIVDKMALENGQVFKNEPQPLRRVLQKSTTEIVTNMMVEGAMIGYAKKGAVAGYKIAGKTGTSQIAGKGGYEKGPKGETIGRTITSYGGFAPAYDPRFVVIVKVERPRSAQYSETTASLVFADIMQYLLEYSGIPKDNQK